MHKYKLLSSFSVCTHRHVSRVDHLVVENLSGVHLWGKCILPLLACHSLIDCSSSSSDETCEICPIYNGISEMNDKWRWWWRWLLRVKITVTKEPSISFRALFGVGVGHKRTRPREESMCRGKMGRGGERAEQNREIERVRSESSFLRVPGEHTLVGLWKFTTHALIAWPY